MRDARLTWPAPERNKEPILEAIRSRLGPAARVLEIASGTGQHAVHLCLGLPGITWWPTDIVEDHLASIAAWRAAAEAPGLQAPARLDVCERPWPHRDLDAVFTANLLHVSPWRVTESLLDGAAEALRPGGELLVYGPFLGVPEGDAESNRAFDRSLRARDPAWGVRTLHAVTARAARAGLVLEGALPMPANNRLLALRRL
jgi:SAM-dependent methyltransferase